MSVVQMKTRSGGMVGRSPFSTMNVIKHLFINKGDVFNDQCECRRNHQPSSLSNPHPVSPLFVFCTESVSL